MKKAEGWLHAEHLMRDGKWAEFTLTVDEVFEPNTITMENKRRLDKWAVRFKETPKRFAIAKTNYRLLAFATGTAKEAEWVGKRVTVYPAAGDWFDEKNLAAVRIRIPDGQPKPKIAAKDLGRDLTGKPVATQARPG